MTIPRSVSSSALTGAALELESVRMSLLGVLTPIAKVYNNLPRLNELLTLPSGQVDAFALEHFGQNAYDRVLPFLERYRTLLATQECPEPAATPE
jgi:hypothetical protein